MSSRTSVLDALLYLLATATFAVFLVRQAALVALDDRERGKGRQPHEG